MPRGKGLWTGAKIVIATIFPVANAFTKLTGLGLSDTVVVLKV